MYIPGNECYNYQNMKSPMLLYRYLQNLFMTITIFPKFVHIHVNNFSHDIIFTQLRKEEWIYTPTVTVWHHPTQLNTLLIHSINHLLLNTSVE
jgi:predicted metal-dependent peptidase